MQAQLSIPTYCRAAYEILQYNPGLSLLGALREASGYDIDIYKDAILFLASRLNLINPSNQLRWPIYALDLAAWETSRERSSSDVRNLLCQ